MEHETKVYLYEALGLKTSNRKFWMITGEGNLPRVRHETEEQAQREADRLARANPGKKFYVLEAIEEVEMPTGIIRNKL